MDDRPPWRFADMFGNLHRMVHWYYLLPSLVWDIRSPPFPDRHGDRGVWAIAACLHKNLLFQMYSEVMTITLDQLYKVG